MLFGSDVKFQGDWSRDFSRGDGSYYQRLCMNAHARLKSRLRLWLMLVHSTI